MKKIAGTLRLELAQFRELAAFAQFGSDLDAKTKSLLDRGQRTVEVFKQIQYRPQLVEAQVGVLWGVSNGQFDDIPVEKVKEFQTKLVDFLATRKSALLAQIQKEKAINDAITAELKKAYEEFKGSFKP